MSVEAGHWLTAVRLGRLTPALRAVRAYPPPGVPASEATRVLWKRCGGPLDDVSRLIEVLRTTDLLTMNEGWIRTTRTGQLVATQDHQRGGRILALSLLRSGHFVSQSRILREMGIVDDETGALICRRDVAVRAAPQLVGLLRTFQEVTFTDSLTVPSVILEELTDLWQLPQREDRVDRRKTIGDRGELYSYRFEQLRVLDTSRIRWVALDDDSLGYDIEDAGVVPHRRIEVKASTEKPVRFILSANEWQVAHRYPDSYEIQFWGDVDLSARERDDYDRLRRQGYPLVCRNVPRLLAEGKLRAAPSHYVVVAQGATDEWASRGDDLSPAVQG